MLDTNKYDYTQLDLPNVMVTIPKGYVANSYKVHGRITPFLDALTKKYPQWKFVGMWHYYAGHTPSDPVYDMFAVYQNGEMLGRISSEHDWKHGDRYEVWSHRIERSRHRGGWSRTKDLKKAMKLIADNFAARSIGELVAVGRSNITDVINRVVSPPLRAHSGAFGMLKEHAAQYFATHWEELKARAAIPVAMLGVDYPALYEAATDAERLSKAFHGNVGVSVVIKDGTYAVTRGEHTGYVNTERLPAELKTMLGMLKLLDNGAFMVDVGVKADDTTYFIMGDFSDQNL